MKEGYAEPEDYLNWRIETEDLFKSGLMLGSDSIKRIVVKEYRVYCDENDYVADMEGLKEILNADDILKELNKK